MKTSDQFLTFGFHNGKLKKSVQISDVPEGIDIWTFSLPAGWTCPGAKDCLARVPRDGGKIQDGPETKFRCFAASQESVFPNVRDSRWHNFDLLTAAKTREAMRDLILESLPPRAQLVRVHVSGDFFNEAYFLAWADVAQACPNRIFYGYTKSVHIFLKHRSDLPPNFRFTASFGGRHDALVVKHGLKYAKVVFSPEEAALKELPIDHDDRHAYGYDGPFALLLHGTQPKNSPAAKSLSAMEARGIRYSYGKHPHHTSD
jgi:hypothetical protein